MALRVRDEREPGAVRHVRRGRPFVVCPYPDHEGIVDLETGWPVSAPFPDGGRVEFTTLPACTVVVYGHRGHYQGARAAPTAPSRHFLEREGLAAAGGPRGIYETSPEEVPDPADWLTEIQIPIVRDEARIAALAR
jgi:effector-binding domain-containing protein